MTQVSFHIHRMLVGAAIALLLLSACSQPSNSGAADTAGDSQSAELGASNWVLTGMSQNGNAQPLAPGRDLTLMFTSDGKLNGSAGCNSFGGTYALDRQQITVSGLQQTLMACDQVFMEQESRYTELLSQAHSFTLADTQLTITSANGELQFSRA